MVYSSNLFYFRNPLTNWNLSSWRLLPQRLAQIRILVLDETIGNPSITLKKPNRKQWTHFWETLGQMERLKVLFFNVDTLYPNIWTAELERKLLGPLLKLRHLPEMHVVVRWAKPAYGNQNPDWFENAMKMPLIRWDVMRIPDELDMRWWIIEKVRALERGEL